MEKTLKKFLKNLLGYQREYNLEQCRLDNESDYFVPCVENLVFDHLPCCIIDLSKETCQRVSVLDNNRVVMRNIRIPKELHEEGIKYLVFETTFDCFETAFRRKLTITVCAGPDSDIKT